LIAFKSIWELLLDRRTLLISVTFEDSGHKIEANSSNDLSWFLPITYRYGVKIKEWFHGIFYRFKLFQPCQL
jgi:hypothetical protein